MHASAGTATELKIRGVRADRGHVGRLFTFRLDPVLDIRRRREEQMQGELAQAIRAAAEQAERAGLAEQAVRDAVETLRSASSQAMQLLELRALNDEIDRLRRVHAYELEMAARMEDIAAERRDELIKASRDREALDGLRRRAEEAFTREEARIEQAEMDELATRRASRASRDPHHRGPSPAGAAA